MSVNFNELMQNAEQVRDFVQFETLPEGTYDVEITTCDYRSTSNGKPMYKVLMTVINGPHQGKPIGNQFVISAENPTALGIFFRDMAVFGFDNAYFATNPAPENLAYGLVGRRARAVLSTREWPAGSGQYRNNVAGIMALPGYTPPAPGASNSPSIPSPGAVSGAVPAAMPTPQPNPQPTAPAVPSAPVAQPAAPVPAPAASAAPTPPATPF